MDGTRGIFVYTRENRIYPIFGRLHDGDIFPDGIRSGEGYVLVARNMPRGIKGEIDLVGYDGETLAFVEVRTRTAREDPAAPPELSVTAEKQHLVAGHRGDSHAGTAR